MTPLLHSTRITQKCAYIRRHHHSFSSGITEFNITLAAYVSPLLCATTHRKNPFVGQAHTTKPVPHIFAPESNHGAYRRCTSGRRLIQQASHATISPQVQCLHYESSRRYRVPHTQRLTQCAPREAGTPHGEGSIVYLRAPRPAG